MIKAVRRGSPLCVTVTHLDGIVAARSGFNSSANYRSVVIHGKGRILTGDEHERALDLMVEALIPGRTRDIRGHTSAESKQTTVFALRLTEMSAKVRTGGPHDDPADLDSEAWAGVVPLHMVAGPPEPDPDGREDIDLPDYLDPYRRFSF
jgi:nitroimidazol reductase NimA-like FMN-containing flavoprotein (pyridoxamine 5'-phosphate oxidase superfamily)